MASELTASRRLSIGRIAAVLGIGQVLLHQALSLLSVETACGTSLRRSHHHAVQPAACLTQVPEPLLHADAGLAMSLAHLLAAAVTAALLSRAQAALWRLVAWFRPLMHALKPVTIFWGGPPRVGPGSRPILSPWQNHCANGIRVPPPHSVPLAWPI